MLKGKKILAILLSVTLAASMLPGMALTVHAADGTSANPYLITSAAELRELATRVNAGTHAHARQGANFRLTTSINVAGEEWIPIGTDANPFRGSFDGDGHTVSGLTHTTGGNDVGLFGVINSDVGTMAVGNLTLAGVNISGSGQNRGGIAGRVLSGDIYRGAVGGSISGLINLGGIVGNVDSTVAVRIIGCNSTATLTASAGGAALNGTGGIAGRFNSNNGRIEFSHFNGNITSTTGNDNNMGGIVGIIHGDNNTINAVSSAGNLDANHFRVGGIVGTIPIATAGTLIVNSHSAVNIVGANQLGGILGFIQPAPANLVTIDNCYFTGNISGLFGAPNVGGILGGGPANAVTRVNLTNSVVVSNSLTFGPPATGGANVRRIWGIPSPLGFASNNHATEPATIDRPYDASISNATERDGQTITNIDNFDWMASGLAFLASPWRVTTSAALNAGLPSINPDDTPSPPPRPTPVAAGAVAPTITTTTLPNGRINQLYNNATTGFALQATGTAPITWNISSGALPGGLSLNSAGVISGTPTAEGTFNFTVRAENSADDDTQALTIVVLPALGAASFTGTGTSIDPFVIQTEVHLQELAERVNVSLTPYANVGMHFLLANDITLTSPWTPIGNAANPFRGRFDGDNNTVANLSSIGMANDRGFFGVIDSGEGIIAVRDLTVTNVNITPGVTLPANDPDMGVNLGGIAGRIITGNIRNCHVSGTISGSHNIGGIVGNVASAVPIHITNSSNSANLLNSYNNPDNGGVGGIVGRFSSHSGYIALSQSTGNIESISLSNGNVGGIVGILIGTNNVINGTASSGNLTTNHFRVGGILGYIPAGPPVNTGTMIVNSHSSAVITSSPASGSQLGGILGFINAVSTTVYIDNTWFNGTAQGNFAQANVGGIFGGGPNVMALQGVTITNSVVFSDLLTGQGGAGRTGRIWGLGANDNSGNNFATHPAITVAQNTDNLNDKNGARIGNLATFMWPAGFSVAPWAGFDANNVPYLDFTAEPPPPPVPPPPTPPTITTPSLPSGMVGTMYNFAVAGFALQAAGTLPIEWSLVTGTLPPGLSLSAAGVIAGTPTADGLFTFTVRAQNAAGFAESYTRAFTISISPLLTTGGFNGNGTAGNPFIISTSVELALLATLVNMGIVPYSQAGTHFRIEDGANIDLSAYNWTPIGNIINPFRGSFDGNNRTITGLTINRPIHQLVWNNDIIRENNGLNFPGGESPQGLFGVIQGATANQAVVQNLTVANVNITNGEHLNILAGENFGLGTGGLVGRIAAGTIRNVHTSGTIDITIPRGTAGYAGDGMVGGIAGMADTANRPRNTGNDQTAALFPPGIPLGITNIGGGNTAHSTASEVHVIIEDSSSTINMTTHLTGSGGLVGSNGKPIRIYRSWYDGSIHGIGIGPTVNPGNGAGAMGGIIGRARNVIDISYSWSAGSLTSSGHQNAGFVGVVDDGGGVIRNSFSTMTITYNGPDPFGASAGIVGRYQALQPILIENAYFAGHVVSGNRGAGIFATINVGAGHATIRNTFTTGTVSQHRTDNHHAGGIVGDVANDGSADSTRVHLTVENSVALQETIFSGMANAVRTSGRILGAEDRERNPARVIFTGINNFAYAGTLVGVITNPAAADIVAPDDGTGRQGQNVYRDMLDSNFFASVFGVANPAWIFENDRMPILANMPGPANAQSNVIPAYITTISSGIPTITAQPTSQSVTVGDNVTFSVSAVGNPAPTFQWQVSTDGGTTWSNIGGAAGASLVLSAVGTALNGNQYRVVVTNSNGSVTSAAVTLTVADAGQQPQTYAVTVTGSHASVTGAGSFAAGATVTINAGTRSGFTFTGWTATPTGVVFANANSATTSFTMPANAVTVTANWQRIGGGQGNNDDQGGQGNNDDQGNQRATPRPSPTPTPTTPQPPTTIVDEEVIIPAVEVEDTLADEALVVKVSGVTITIPENAICSQVVDGEDLVVDVLVVLPGDESDAMLDVTVGISSGNNAITQTNAPYTIVINFPELGISVDASTNTYRIVAIAEDGTLLGGRFDPETGLFTLDTQYVGNFSIAYVATLRRLNLQVGGYLIYDLANNRVLQEMDVPITIIHDRTIVPLRFVAYALGASDVNWNQQTRAATIVHNGRTLSVVVDELLPGMDVPAVIMDDRTMVPLRFVSEFFGVIVGWCPDTRTVEMIMM